MKKRLTKVIAFTVLAVIILVTSCKKDNLFKIYPNGTTFTTNNDHEGQTGADINYYMTDSSYLANFGMKVDPNFTKLNPNINIFPTAPYTIVAECPGCYSGEMGYFSKSANDLLYEIPESSIKVIHIPAN